MQNGYLDAYLESKGLLDNTQVLLYLSVTAMGAAAVDGVTKVNPEGQLIYMCLFCVLIKKNSHIFSFRTIKSSIFPQD